MPRGARIYGETGIYHIMLRGNERKKIFVDNEDRKRFVGTMFEKTSEENSKIYAYCLMDNHVHLLLSESDNNLAKLMKRINVSYVYFFNKKYKRIGHLFQDRFKSEYVDRDDYLLEAVRYIHNNPVKAGMVNTPKEYYWSSYNDYINNKINNNLYIDQILDYFSDNRIMAIDQFIDFSNLNGEIQFIDYEEKDSSEKRQEQEQNARITFDNILYSKKTCKEDLHYKNNYELRNEVIICLKEMYDLSARQMEEITSINRGIVQKIYNEIIKKGQ